VGSLLKITAYFCTKLAEIATEKVDKYGARYVAFGVFSVINCVFPFFMWSESKSCVGTIAFIRITAVILNVFLIMHKLWNKKYRKYLPVYWYFTVMYSLSFSASYMLFIEGFSALSTINILFAFMLSLMLLDFTSFFTIFFVGVFLAFLLSEFIGVRVPLYQHENISFQTIYVILFSGIIAAIFSIDREKNEHERIITLRDFGGTIAHEMRTPLSSVLLLCKLIDREVEKEKPSFNKIISNIKKVCREVHWILLYIDMIIFKLNRNSDLFAKLEEFSMKECVLDVIAQYPLDNNEKKLIIFDSDNDFIIRCCGYSIRHVLFNLVQNAIYQIKSANKGRVIISLSECETNNILSFKNTISDVNSTLYSELFSPMIDEKFSAIGLGLYFCKNVMEAIGGSINCSTISGGFIEFVLIFPKVVQNNR
jgi:signal transduction histidine kinase